MNENIVELLLYLFENYIYDNDNHNLDRQSLRNGLTQAGFAPTAINNAFSWLEELNNDVDDFHKMPLSPNNFRVFSLQERMKIDQEGIDFIYYLSHSGILDGTQREILINAIMKLETNQFDVDDLHWLALMVLFSQPDQEQAFANLEALMFDSTEFYEH